MDRMMTCQGEAKKITWRALAEIMASATDDPLAGEAIRADV